MSNYLQTTPPHANSNLLPLLEARNVFKSYRLGRVQVDVLRGVNLKVNQGEFVALLGASGAGKTTLLHLLGGLDRPSSGHIFFGGQDLGKLSAKQLTQFRLRKVGFVFQFYCLLPELDALENVVLPARLARRAASEAYQEAINLLNRIGLGHRIHHKPAELSGGEQQRLAIARALINRPLAILADEPTGNLDSKTGASILDLLCQLQQENNLTLIITTHDPSVAARANRIVELVDGQIKE